MNKLTWEFTLNNGTYLYFEEQESNEKDYLFSVLGKLDSQDLQVAAHVFDDNTVSFTQISAPINQNKSMMDLIELLGSVYQVSLSSINNFKDQKAIQREEVESAKEEYAQRH